MKKSILYFSFIIGLMAQTGVKSAEDFSDRVMPNDRTDIILSYNNAIKFAKRGVINISTKRRIKGRGLSKPALNDPFFRDFFGDNLGSYLPKERLERSLGSGVIISSDGYILTNNHIIDGASEIIVTLGATKAEYHAKVVGKDLRSDLAVLRINVKGLNPIKFANSKNIKVGDIVFAVGNPFGVGESISQGIISGIDSKGLGTTLYEDYIQTDASINAGNSGGALVDSRGYLVGINTAINSSDGHSSGIGMAISSNIAKKIANDLIIKGKIDRGYLGISINNLSKELYSVYGKNYGAVIVSVDKYGVAYKSGLRRGDLIIGINGRKIINGKGLKNEVGNKEPNDVVRVDIVRDLKRKAYNVRLGRLTLKNTPMSGARVFEGLVLDQLTSVERKKNRLEKDVAGIVVAKVILDSKAQSDGFIVDDIIMQVEDIEIADLNDLKRAYRLYKKRTKRVYITRRGYMKIIVVR